MSKPKAERDLSQPRWLASEAAKPRYREEDAHIGARILLARILNGWSEVDFAAHLGVSHGQVQKMQSGDNRTSASRLFDISRITGFPISFFFEVDIGMATQEIIALAGYSSRETMNFVKMLTSLSSEQRAQLKQIIQLPEA